MAVSWQVALRNLLAKTYEALARDGVGWAVVGSAASALQGCDFTPGDVDVLTAEANGVDHFARLLVETLPATCSYSVGHDLWRSSQALPVAADEPDPAGFQWHFARIVLDGFKVEIAHIAPPSSFAGAGDGAGIWEAGPEIWPYVHTIPFAGYQVPVVPLEIQLKTALDRGQEDRVGEIRRTLSENGCNVTLLRKSLGEKWQAYLF